MRRRVRTRERPVGRGPSCIPAMRRHVLARERTVRGPRRAHAPTRLLGARLGRLTPLREGGAATSPYCPHEVGFQLPTPVLSGCAPPTRRCPPPTGPRA